MFGTLNRKANEYQKKLEMHFINNISRNTHWTQISAINYNNKFVELY
jgi:hypothetical protein